MITEMLGTGGGFEISERCTTTTITGPNGAGGFIAPNTEQKVLQPHVDPSIAAATLQRAVTEITSG